MPATATDLNYTELARRAAGNHRKWSNFLWFGKPPDPVNWTIQYTHNRDSGLLDVSNGEAIGRALDRFTYGDHPTVIPQDRRRLVADGTPDGWAGQVYEWLSANNDRELENRDDRGAYPSRNAIAEALNAIGILDAEYCTSDE
jgi:hypothetical protein